MKYYSTNRRTPEVSLREAVVASMAPDNGLYMPERIERLPDAFFDGIARLDLHRIACRVADAFFGEEIEPETLRRIVRDTFCFDIPVVRVDDGIWALELFHGPTMAFKDVGARFMARILSTSSKAATTNTPSRCSSPRRATRAAPWPTGFSASRAST